MQLETFHALVLKAANAETVDQDTVLFGSGLDLSSIAFLEFIMTLEEETGVDVDVDSLDNAIVTVGQLYWRLFPAD